MSTVYCYGRFMSNERLSPQEFRVWHAFQVMNQEVISRVSRDLSEATGLSGSDFAVISRLAGVGKGGMRQQALAECLGWDKSRLSHQLTRMQQRGLIERREEEARVIVVAMTREGERELRNALPIHAASVRRHLLSRLSAEQTAAMVRISNLLGDDD